MDTNLFQMAELNKELKPYYTEENGIPMIKHPLVFSIFHTDIQNYIINKHYEWKKNEIKKAIKNKKWSSFIFLHERPYRLSAFTAIEADLRKEPKRYWELLADIWVDSENIWQNKHEWRYYLKNGPKKNQEYFMTPEERKELKNMPDKITVYRGYVPGKNKGGLSYTTSKKMAEWFANRFGGNGKLLERVVDKKDIFAYKSSRNEEEIIILD